MKLKIPFSLNYRDKIENGEFSVCTRDRRKARIICYDKKGEHPVVVLVDGDSENLYTVSANGMFTDHALSNRDLLVCVEKEDEPTEFEKYISDIVDSQVCVDNGGVYAISEKLLNLAEKQLEKKFRMESFQQGYKQTLGEAQDAMLESVPKWKHLAKGDSLYLKGHMYLRRGPRGAHRIVAIVMGECDYIDIKELDKLPKKSEHESKSNKNWGVD